ncbi:LPXTG cell wall anchor domain-containing protein [Pseudarthrobacter sp. H2]|uniref:LPXTG cell wall anchor domain-containing protein n=1 Tax=Pseudarthrobacter sp. H2 TaxID=3418415 RepID=UPI003CEB36E5
MKKSLAALVLAGSVALIGAVPAMADDYTAPNQGDQGGEQGQVDNGDVQEGEQFNFSGGGFTPNEPIRVDVEETGGPQAIGGGFSGGASMAAPTKITLPSATQTFNTQANASGRFSLPVSINGAGTYRLTATGLVSGHSVPATVTVKAAAGGSGTGLTNNGGGTATNSGPALANTGADTSLVLWSLVGAGALAAGVTSVVVVRRRAKADAAA